MWPTTMARTVPSYVVAAQGATSPGGTGVGQAGRGTDLEAGLARIAQEAARAVAADAPAAQHQVAERVEHCWSRPREGAAVDRG